MYDSNACSPAPADPDGLARARGGRLGRTGRAGARVPGDARTGLPLVLRGPGGRHALDNRPGARARERPPAGRRPALGDERRRRGPARAGSDARRLRRLPGSLRPELDRARHADEDAARDHLVDHAVRAGLLGTEDEIALRVRVDPLDGLPRVLGQDLLDATTLPGDLGRVDLDVGRLSLDPAVGLMEQDPGVRQREPLAARAR